MAGIIYAINGSRSTGPWKTEGGPLISTSAYLGCNLTGANADTGNVSVVFIADGLSNSNHTVTLFTPGCLPDQSCDRRGIVNMTGSYAIQAAPGIPEAAQVYQTNDYDKYDTIYQGPVNATSGGFNPTVTLTPDLSSGGTYFVAQYIKFIETSSPTNTTNSSDATPTQSTTKTASVTITAITHVGAGRGLDNGAKIGLGIGISLGVLLCAVIALTVWFWFRRTRTTASLGTTELPHNRDKKGDGSGLTKPELHGESSHAELPEGSLRIELPSKSVPTELPGKSM